MENENKRKYCRIHGNTRGAGLITKHGCIACLASKQVRLFVPYEDFKLRRSNQKKVAA